jgi:hypothetical protein
MQKLDQDKEAVGACSMNYSSGAQWPLWLTFIEYRLSRMPQTDSG